MSFPKTAIAVLVWLVLIKLFDEVVWYSIRSPTSSSIVKTKVYQIIIPILNALFYISLPVVGFMADLKFGRFNTAMFYVIMCMLSIVLWILYSAVESVSEMIIVSIAQSLSLYSKKAFYLVALTFGADQLMDAPTQYFTFYIWLHTWCAQLGFFATSIISCTVLHKSYIIYVNSIHLFGVILIIISGLATKKYFISCIPAENPFKLIYNVLKFAYNNKSPLKRSAFTYWEETRPSRIDLGKSKYGGPFDERIVESVKTFLRLLPLVCIVSIIAFPFQASGRLSKSDVLSGGQCLISATYFTEYCIGIVLIPIYLYFTRYYCCFRINLLKKIGCGFFISVLGKLGYIIVDVIVSLQVYYGNNHTTCLNETEVYTPINVYYLVLPNIINSVGALLIIPTSVEFVFAQAPYSMRGLLIGLWYCFIGLYETIGWESVKLIHCTIPSSVLYINVVNFAVIVVGFVLFVIVSKWYKLHSHGDLFSVHDAVEKYYENDFERRDTYISDYGTLDQTT